MLDRWISSRINLGMATLSTAVAAVSLLAPAAVAQDTTARRFAPEVEVQHQEYAAVRLRFRTRLLRRGPSPQAEPTHHPPAGVREVEFASGGRRLRAWIGGDAGPGVKLPAVLFLHGGFAFGPADWEMALPYWEAGYVVMMPMLRGENGQRGSFSLFYDEVADVLAAAEYLDRLPSVDRSRIFVAGHSAGGTLAMLAAEASRRFRAVAAFDGSPDQQLLYNGAASKPGVHPEVVFDAHDLNELRVRSPLAWARSLRTPARLYYSAEASVYFQNPTLRMADVARERGADVRAIPVEGTHLSHVPRAMGRSIAFFDSTAGVLPGRNLRRRTVPQPPPSLTGNTTFQVNGFETARVVALAGTFNGWDPKALRFGRENGRWVCRIDLPPGKHLYKFVVDGEWILDPANPATEPDGNGNTNSVLVK